VMKSRAPTHRVSTLQDLERGRGLEVEETLGYVVTKAGKQGVPVPTVETCYRLISGINRFV
jgi:2-dehydropantoate 2-reductase